MQIKNHEDALFEAIYSSVIENMRPICSSRDPKTYIDKISSSKSFIRSICLLPYWFFSSFENENRKDLQNELFILGKASLQGWIAYTLYDYARDGKIDKTEINQCLSIANIMYQKTVRDFYDLAGNDRTKVDIINSMLNTMDTSYIDIKTVEDIHHHFKYMCDNAYKKSVGAAIVPLLVTWLLGYPIGSNNHIETLEFFKHYLNARQLSDDEDDMVDDMLQNVYTPATFLMRAQYGSDYIRAMMRSRIDMSMRMANEALRNLALFDYEKFIELYVKEC